MATRFYFPHDTAAEVTPVANGSWGYTSEALNRKLVETTKSNTALTNGSQIGPWTAGQTALDRRYVSRPLEGAQTLSGTVKCYLMAREFNNGDNTTSRLEIYVVHRDGSTVRGTALAIGQYGPATELLNNATLRNKAFADGDTITSVSCQDGDRIVVCIGYTDAAGSTPEGQCKFGDPTSGTDLAENETGTTANPGWIEFSANLTFETGTVYDGASTLTGASGFTAAATRSTAGAATVAGAGAMTAAATSTQQGSTSMAGSGTLTASGTRALFGSGVISANSVLTADATVSVSGEAVLAGGGVMSALATAAYPGGANLAGSGTMTATATAAAIVEGAAVLVGGPNLVAFATVSGGIKSVNVSHRGGSTSLTDED